MMARKKFKKIMALCLSLVMMLSVVSIFTINAKAVGVFDSVQISYLNNDFSGQYLHNSSGTVAATSGYIDNLGNTIRWQITPLADGTYTIQSSSNLALYLSSSLDTSVPLVRLMSLSDSSIPNEYRWNISRASGGGCLIQNVYTEQYLCQNGSILFFSSTLGPVGTYVYNKHVWRIADSISFYGNTSNYTYRELTVGYSFKTLYMFAGETKAPVIKDQYSNVLWKDAKDFTFTGYNSSSVTLNTETGYFTASAASTMSVSTVTATHQVTGLVSTFTLVVNPKAVCVGVTASGHDHVSSLNAISSNLRMCGYSSANVYTGEFATNTIDGYLDSDANNVFVSRSHAGLVRDGDSVMGTHILLEDDLVNGIVYTSVGSIQRLDLTNMKLVLFIGCQTAHGGSSANNLVSVAVEQGAATAVGFRQSIDCDDANKWTQDFFALLESGLSVNAACMQLASQDKYSATTMTSYLICGYGSARLN